MHQDKSKYTSTKVIPLGSTAFRQPYADSHCKFIHGYRLQAKFWFTCSKLDRNNWVVDFGALKELKNILEQTFDHTTVVWAKDPERATFETLHQKGIIDLRIFPDGVGIEKFAEFCYKTAQKFVSEKTNDRCWVDKVEVWEHEQNSATYENTSSHGENKIGNTPITEQNTPSPSPVPAPPPPSPVPPVPSPQCPPLHYPKTQNTYKDLFKGTSWGNK